MDANQAADLPIEFYKTYVQLSAALIAILITIVAFYIKASFIKQEKKDMEQDAQIQTMDSTMRTTFTRLTDAIVSIDKATAIQQERLEQHAKDILKHDKILENLAKSTRR